MKINITNNADTIEIKIIGKVDTLTAPAFEAEIGKVLEVTGANVVVECDSLSYVSSAGLRVFLMLLKGVTANGGKLTIKNLNNDIKEVFNITGFSSLFTII